jgi:hypothetical protein
VRLLAVAVVLFALPAGAEEAPPATSWIDALKLGGYAQVDWVLSRQSSQDEVDPSTGEPLNQTRFLLRRGHLRVDYDTGDYVFGDIEIDANTVNGPIVRPIDAEVSARWPKKDLKAEPVPTPARPAEFVSTLGLMKIPFGFEVIEADNVRPFLERAAVLRAMFPGEFDLGVRFKLAWRAFDLALALMNGAPIGAAQFPGRDPNESKDMVGRFGIDTPIVEGVRFVAGVSGVTGTGFHKGTPTTKDTIVWRDVNEDGIVEPTEIQVIAGTPATPSQNYKRFALGGDARLLVDVPVVGELALRAEIVTGKNIDRGLLPADPVSVGRDLRETGWYVGATQEITRWGMIGVRYDRYDPDADASRQAGAALVPSSSTFTTLAMMGMLRYKAGRLVLEYDKNTNPLGRDPNGAPTTLKDDTVTLRGQVTF